MFIAGVREYYLKIVKEEHADVCSTSTVLQKILYPISKIYGFVVTTRIFFYKKGILKTVRFPVPVISVGNITVGGTGKTPVVEYISRYLQKKGKKVAILSRGYAAHIKQKNRSLSKDVCNDEYLLLRENVPEIPNILNKNRIKGGLEAINLFQTEYLLLDDGFQHLKLARDIDIVTIDALNPFGYEQTFPRGLLREPLEGLKRADLIILTHADQCNQDAIAFITNRLHKIAGHVPVIETVHKPTCLEAAKDSALMDISCLSGKKVFGFCAIGNPMSFRKSMESLGAELVGFQVFPDHHVYTSSELEELNIEAQRVKPDAIIITQKDKVKLRNNCIHWNYPLWTLKIEICIVKGLNTFENKINAILN